LKDLLTRAAPLLNGRVDVAAAEWRERHGGGCGAPPTESAPDQLLGGGVALRAWSNGVNNNGQREKGRGVAL